MDRRPQETLWDFRRRQTCSTTDCTGQGIIGPDFQGAVPAAMLPAHCPRRSGPAICGGPWRVVEDGVRCFLCGHGIAVVEALIAQARRGLSSRTDSAWPVPGG
jgi:hypothetical protein